MQFGLRVPSRVQTATAKLTGEGVGSLEYFKDGRMPLRAAPSRKSRSCGRWLAIVPAPPRTHPPEAAGRQADDALANPPEGNSLFQAYVGWAFLGRQHEIDVGAQVQGLCTNIEIRKFSWSPSNTWGKGSLPA